MKHTILALALGLLTIGATANAASPHDDTLAGLPADACKALGGGMMLSDDCKAFDGSPIAGVQVCVNGNAITLLIADLQGKIVQASETSSQTTAGTLTYVAGSYSLEVPTQITPNTQFDAVVKLPLVDGRAPTAALVCTSSR